MINEANKEPAMIYTLTMPAPFTSRDGWTLGRGTRITVNAASELDAARRLEEMGVTDVLAEQLEQTGQSA